MFNTKCWHLLIFRMTRYFSTVLLFKFDAQLLRYCVGISNGEKMFVFCYFISFETLASKLYLTIRSSTHSTIFCNHAANLYKICKSRWLAYSDKTDHLECFALSTFKSNEPRFTVSIRNVLEYVILVDSRVAWSINLIW